MPIAHPRAATPMEPYREAFVIVAVQCGCAHGVQIIETRTLIAYGLILLMAAAAIFGIALMRYNSYDRKIARRREREQVRRDERNDAAPRPD